MEFAMISSTREVMTTIMAIAAHRLAKVSVVSILSFYSNTLFSLLLIVHLILSIELIFNPWNDTEGSSCGVGMVSKAFNTDISTGSGYPTCKDPDQKTITIRVNE